MCNMIRALAVLATVYASWPRMETGETWYRAVHVPKAGGTTHDRALVAIYCFHAGQETCMRQCHVKKKGRIMALYRNATHIWCAEWHKALRDRESCVRTYAHARPGTPAPCR